MVKPIAQSTFTLHDTFDSAQEAFFRLTEILASSETMVMKHSALETLISSEGREIHRRLLEEHIRLRGMGDLGASVTGIDGVQRTHKRIRQRTLISIFGEVLVERVGYSARGVASLFPKDASLNLPKDSYSHGIQKIVAREASKSSFDEVVLSLKEITGLSIPKRVAEDLTIKAAIDFDAFYQQLKPSQNTQEIQALPLVILTTDGKGIVMRQEDLRDVTRKRAELTQHKLNKRMSRGEKANSKRMSTVASVYSIDEFKRTPEQVMGELNSLQTQPQLGKRPSPVFKRVWASIDKSSVEVTEALFDEAMLRDPQKQKKWVCLIDGDPRQLNRIRQTAKKHEVNLTIIMDIIHIIEYLWKAARVFYTETSHETEKWVTERLLKILQGKASQVAAGIRRSATLKKISEVNRKPIDKCVNYLLNNSDYLQYDEYLKNGFPIATGIIEGACRHLIKDRMDVTGARWSLKGAEAVIKLRSLRASKDFERYWEFHEYQEYLRNHRSQYMDPSILGPAEEDVGILDHIVNIPHNDLSGHNCHMSIKNISKKNANAFTDIPE